MARLIAFREKHGFCLCWRALRVEFYWWPLHLGARVSRDSEGWHGHARGGPLSLFVSLQKWPLWTEGRECEVSVHDWTIRFVPFGRVHEWRNGDPWYVRGVSIDLRRLVLGTQTYTTEEVAAGVRCVVPMPEGHYEATAKVERQTWKRARWFKRVRTSVWLQIPNGGIPFAGKGENSWDCGDDGLCGIGGETVDDAITRARESVMRSRKRYGMPSPESMSNAKSI